MANQSVENTWGSKYRKKNDRAPPEIYEEVNTVVLEARPGTPPQGQTIPRLPVEEDFPKYIENRVVSLNTPKEEVQYVIVVLHGYAASQHTLYEFAKKHLLGPRTACIFVRGTTQVGETGTYCWSDKGNYIGGPAGKDRALQLIRRAGTGFSSIQSSEFAGPSRSNTANTTTASLNNVPNRAADVSDDDIGRPTYENCTERIGVEVIANVLIKTCGFRARDIAIVGHDQGGTAALAVAAACWQTKFGGVVSIGGPLPNDFPDGIESRTHVLLLGGKLGDLSPTECARIQRAFSGTIEALKRYDPPTDGDDYNDINNAELKEFVAHQLRREEWTKEAVLTFDGGGIRGYGSLLMLKALMDKIAYFEKDLDKDVEASGKRKLSESSFSPCGYPPREVNGTTVQRTPHTLDDDELYLPCHYFTFIGGTSTGGLISIMISRFRMTVSDCIKEYKDLGEKVFGHPRPPGIATIITHKFDADDLKKAICDVTKRHGNTTEDENSTAHYPCHEDLCQTIVAARADKGGVTLPFLFRTYDCREDEPAGSRNPPLNAGRAAPCSIFEVGRATSAATNYFRPINIKNWGVRGFEKKEISFVDGGFGTNNPSHEILRDIKRKRRAPSEVIEVFASFGTGVSDEHLEGKLTSLFRMVEEMKKEITNVLPAHRAMEDDSGIHDEDGHKRFRYFRFDGGKALGGVAMDEWSGRRRSQMRVRSRPTGEETLIAMDMAVKKFLKEDGVKEGLDELALILVRRRRLRTRDTLAWERYACASRYECSQAGCHAWLYTPEELRAHLRSEHTNLLETEFSTAVEGSKKCWTYRGAEHED